MRVTRRRVCANAHTRADLMIDYGEKVNGVYHVDEGGVEKMRGGFARKFPFFYLFFRGFEKSEKILLENLDCSR